MDKIAKRVQVELTKPLLEKMLDDGISEKEMIAVGQMTDIAKDLVEYDILCKKLKQMGGDDDEMEEMVEPASDERMNPKKDY